MNPQEMIVLEADDVQTLRDVFRAFPQMAGGLGWDDFLVGFYERQRFEDYRILAGYLNGTLVAAQGASKHFQVADMQWSTVEFGGATLVELWLQMKK